MIVRPRKQGESLENELEMLNPPRLKFLAWILFHHARLGCWGPGIFSPIFRRRKLSADDGSAATAAVDDTCARATAPKTAARIWLRWYAIMLPNVNAFILVCFVPVFSLSLNLGFRSKRRS